MPSIQRFEQLRDTARNTRDLIKQRATHYIDCYRVERWERVVRWKIPNFVEEKKKNFRNFKLVDVLFFFLHFVNKTSIEN